MTAKKTEGKRDIKTEVGVGVGVAVAAAAAIAGAYFLYGSKDAKKNRKKISGWMLKAKGEVLEKIEKYKEELTEEAYYKIVDTVVAKYGAVKDSSSEEVSALGKELKSHWGNIKKHLLTSKPKSKSTSMPKAKPKAKPKAIEVKKVA